MSNCFFRLFYKFRDSIAARVNNRCLYDMQSHALTSLALNSSLSGVCDTRYGATEVIVSLTTHGRRIYDVYLAIESIMQGSFLPNRIVLWLSTEFSDFQLPTTLKNQRARGLEIRYTEDIGPYTKNIPAFKVFPEATIVTIDDDILYPFDTLEMLLNAHRLHSKSICANRVLRQMNGNSGYPISFSCWRELSGTTTISQNNFFEGVGSVLYPPNCFDEEVYNLELIRQLCPTADDVWFNVAALRMNIPVVPANVHYDGFPLLINESVQDSALWQINNGGGITSNDVQLKAVLDYFHCSYTK